MSKIGSFLLASVFFTAAIGLASNVRAKECEDVVGNFRVTLVDVVDEGDGLVTYSYDVCKIKQDNGAKGRNKVTFPNLSHFVWDWLHIDCLNNDSQLDDLIAGACMGYVDAQGTVTDLRCDIVYELGYDPTTGLAGIKINMDGVVDGIRYDYNTNGCLRFEITFDESALREGCVLKTGVIRASSKAGQDVAIATVCGPICDCDPTECDGETAWAKGEDVSTCFFDFGIPNNNRWGWSNALPYVDGGESKLELYAAAAQCDTDKGAWVGTVTVEINTDTNTATVSYDVAVSGWTLGTTHVYVGNDPIPTGKKGQLTVAPGQLGSTILDGTSHVVVFEYDGTGPIYVLAHAEVEYCEKD
jgi:hypothetical protein